MRHVGYVCGCGFKARNATGLSAHQRAKKHGEYKPVTVTPAVETVTVPPGGVVEVEVKPSASDLVEKWQAAWDALGRERTAHVDAIQRIDDQLQALRNAVQQRTTTAG